MLAVNCGKENSEIAHEVNLIKIDYSGNTEFYQHTKKVYALS